MMAPLPAEKPAAPKEDTKPYKLPPEIEKIILDAAKDMKGKLFGDKEDV